MSDLVDTDKEELTAAQLMRSELAVVTMAMDMALKSIQQSIDDLRKIQCKYQD